MNGKDRDILYAGGFFILLGVLTAFSMLVMQQTERFWWFLSGLVVLVGVGLVAEYYRH